ncbi:MAG: hypothetical protein NT128_02370 [Proteobacteria bacterium]|nr:hypothetical protein [Pseudomonadota bacterium]
MKIIYICLLLSLMIYSVLKASCDDTSSLTSLTLEDSILPAVLAAIDKPGHLGVFEDSFPPLTTHKDIAAKRDLIMRIDRMYGAHLKANPNFHRLITPLIDITPDLAGSYHMSFVWSDCRLSYLKLYAETINPAVFTYDGVLDKLAEPNGLERYAFFMKRVTSFPQPTDLSRAVWANIFNINEAQFCTLNEVLDTLDLHANLKEFHIKNIFEYMFQRSVWDEAYWQRFTDSLSPVRRSTDFLPALDVG